MKVKDILANKDNALHCIRPDDTVFDALKIMADEDVGALLVMNGNQLAGIFTERDYARKIVLKGKFSKDTLIAEVMDPTPLIVTEDDDVSRCMNLMTEHFTRYLPVMRHGAIAGIVSIGDAVKAVITDQEFIIENLSSYIAGGR